MTKLKIVSPVRNANVNSCQLTSASNFWVIASILALSSSSRFFKIADASFL